MLAVPRARFEEARDAIVEYQESSLPSEGDSGLGDDVELNEGETGCPACGHVAKDDPEECPDCGIRFRD